MINLNCDVAQRPLHLRICYNAIWHVTNWIIIIIIIYRVLSATGSVIYRVYQCHIQGLSSAEPVIYRVCCLQGLSCAGSISVIYRVCQLVCAGKMAND